MDQITAQAVAHGARIVEGPVDRPWNVREVRLLEPDGFSLVFTQPLDVTMAMDAVIQNVVSAFHTEK